MKAIINKKVLHNYFILEKIEVGVSLSGAEVKSVRAGSVSLTDGFVRITNGEAGLYNVYIAPYKLALDPSYDPKRTRKLLLHKKEIDYLLGKLTSANLTIVPTKVYITRNLVKVEIALAKSKRKVDKREVLKRKTVQRETESLLRQDKRIAQ